MSEPALHRLSAACSEALPWLPLGDWPAPLARLPAAADSRIGQLWLKRDDISAISYGGNKVRKLEFLLGDARRQQKSAVLTYGGLGSNHALATAIYAGTQGLRCAAVLTPEPVTAAVRTALQWHSLLGTQIVVARDYTDVQRQGERLRVAMGADSCYEIPFGGSSPLGTLGFVSAGLELAEQVRAGLMPPPDRIYLACGTAGSTAGLALGLQLAGLRSRIIAVQVTPDSLKPELHSARLFREAWSLLQGCEPALPVCTNAFLHLEIRKDQLGEGYARPTPAACRARDWFETATGLPMSLTYTAKALAAMQADAARGDLHKATVLFWNTYNSQPAPADLAKADWRSLPGELHGCFDSAQD